MRATTKAAPAILLPILLLPIAAGADPVPAASPAGPPAHQPVQPVPHGVLVPDRGIDPGMKVINPRMPPRSTPVVHPDRTAPNGTVVVPK